jgi:hypothetical protein
VGPLGAFFSSLILKHSSVQKIPILPISPTAAIATTKEFQNAALGHLIGHLKI